MVAVQMMMRRAQPNQGAARSGRGPGAVGAEEKRGRCRHRSRVAGQKYTGIGQNEIKSGKNSVEPGPLPSRLP
jgi:hypothetical protein